jgi:hypothetical protein
MRFIHNNNNLRTKERDKNMSKSKINVIKVPNEGIKPTAPMDFPRMPRMYLELMENKEKVKPSLVNKEYDPDEVETVTSELQSHRVFNQTEDNEDDDLDDDENFEDDDDNNDDNENDDNDNENDNDDIDNDNDNDNDNNDDIDNESIKDSDDNELENEQESVSGSIKSKENFSEEEDLEFESEENENGFIPPLSKRNDIRENFDKSETGSIISQQSRKSIPLTREENIQKNKVREKLKEILRDPPKLSELEQRGEVRTKKTIPNMSSQSIEEEDELKRELLYKFELVKRSYKNVDIPEFNMHSDYKNMNRTYENTLRRVSLDSNVENYRNYLIAGFMLMEYILGYWLKFDMAGFTQQQILNMNQYERLLIELGEKSYVPDDKKWPVELRLLGMIILNAVIFIVAKMIMTKTGTSLFGLMNAQQSEFQKNKPKRKMKGPSIDLSAIPDIEDQN